MTEIEEERMWLKCLELERENKRLREIMNIGSLYTVKKYFWLLFPTKALTVGDELHADGHGHAIPFAAFASIAADYWSRRYNCEVTYFCPDSIVVFLEEDGNYKKVLTSDGKLQRLL
jgi:hypothetical protein